MQKICSRISAWTAAVLFLSLFVNVFYDVKPARASGTAYYVDSAAGNDANSGTSQAQAWKTLAKVNATTFQPGDQILFKSGGVWNGQLWPKGSGTDGSPIVIDKYGTGSKPVINGGGSNFNQTVYNSSKTYNTGTVFLRNQEYWEIKNLEVTNDDNFSVENNDSAALRAGIFVVIDANESDRVYNHIYIRNNDVHDVDGSNNAGPKENGGIITVIQGTAATSTRTYARFNDVRIENNSIRKVDRVGIRAAAHSNYVNDDSFSTTSTRTYGNWNTNVYIGHNHLEDVGGDSIILRDTDGALVEYNVANRFGTRVASTNAIAAIWLAVAKNTVLQYNEAFGGPASNQDGCAWDFDLYLENTTYQYNYSHDNPMGHVLMMGTNKNDVMRYHISQNEGNIIRHFNANEATPASIYNNVFYYNGASHKVIGGNDATKTGYQFTNNIFYNANPSVTTNWGTAANWGQTSFSNNIFYEASGTHSVNEPADPVKRPADPSFTNPGGAGTGLATAAAYRLKAGSPALNAGKLIASNGGKDYFGGVVSAAAAPNIGAYNGAGVPATPPAGVKAPTADAYVLDGSGAGVNYGTAPTLYVKDGTAAGYTRKAYLKFDVSGLTAVNSAKLRLFGGNTQDASNVQVKVSGAAADGWTETGLTWNNAPAAVTGALSTIQVGSTLTYYELDVTSFVKDQLSDGIVTLIVEGVSDQDRTIQFNSRENSANKPELVVN
ncbi:CBM96 family carbohydrate-binding protein [Paenibacillus chitinolyticus]|uniref:CBM96 family carbohydrate-binding protein n=1 Tax=Paenibacillus chitinolyticus TaxID=79263 RepID=UPI003672D944